MLELVRNGELVQSREKAHAKVCSQETMNVLGIWLLQCVCDTDQRGFKRDEAGRVLKG